MMTTAPRVLRVALTGGIASGKSTVLQRFASLGAPTLDADLLARAAVAPGSPGLTAVAARFGPGVLDNRGHLNRGNLGRVVFADPAARADLERIVHPFVFAAIERWYQDLAAADGALPIGGPQVCGIADVPLLFETGANTRFDRTIVAWCAPEQQIERLIARDALSLADARSRLAAQMPIDEKRRLADDVVDTSGSITETMKQVDELYQRLIRTTPTTGT